jgi:hypothetical protein
MESGQHLFEILTGFKQPDNSGKTSQKRLIEYCVQVLGATERLHVDFKEKSDRRDSQLSDDDKKNLAKAVSGFANSGGGVLIWGLEDSTILPKPISDIQQFTSACLGLAPQLTEPIVPGIDEDWLPADTNKPNEGFGLIYVPESALPPHRVVLNHREVKNHYYVRSGDSFVVAPHTQLEDMFGRRPRPVLSLSKRFLAGRHPIFKDLVGDITVVLGIQNTGRGSARAPILAMTVLEPYKIHENGIDGNGHFGLPELTTALDVRELRFGSIADIVIHSGIVHDVAKVIVQITNDMEDKKVKVPDLIIDYQIGAEGMQLIKGRDTTIGQELLSEFEKLANR